MYLTTTDGFSDIYKNWTIYLNQIVCVFTKETKSTNLKLKYMLTQTHCYLSLNTRHAAFVVSHCAVLAVVVGMLLACASKPSCGDLNAKRNAADSVVVGISGRAGLDSLIDVAAKRGDHILEMRARRQLGRTYRESNLFMKAIDCHQQELSLAQQIHDTIAIVQALNNIGTNFRRMGVLDEAVDYHYRALHLCEAFSVQADSTARKNRVVSLNGIGNICLTLGDKETADSVFRAALAGEKMLGSHLGQAINYANIGSLFEQDRQIDSAWTYYRMSMEQNRQAKSNLGISLCYTHFGRLYEKQGKTAKAIAEYQKSYAIMAQSDDRWHAMEPCLALAQVYVKLGDFVKAKHYLVIADNEARKLKSLEYQSQVAWLFYNIYNKEGNCGQALAYYKAYNELGDSVASEKNLVHMQNMRVRYEHEQRKAEVDAINKEYHAERTLRVVGFATTLLIFVLAAVVIMFLVYALRMRKRKQMVQQQMNDMRLSFFTNITHEFRTPLTVILGYAHMMEQGKLPPEEVVSIGHMVSRQGLRLLSLINQLLDIQKVKSAVGHPDWRRGDLVLFVATVVESYLNLAHTQRISLMYAPKQQKAECDFVPDYVQKVVCNLVTNAIKFSKEGGRVLVTLDVSGDFMMLRVADYGAGISESDSRHVFEPFYQTDSKQKSIGSGVGLALVKQIVTSLGGSISLDSRLGVGSVFTVKLPVKAPAGIGVKPIEVYGAMAQQMMADADAEGKGDDGGVYGNAAAEGDDRQIVLIVEDNADVAKYMSMQLASQYQLIVAHDGEEGLRMATETVPDIIITDLMMPKMDGYELCQAVKQADVLNHIPVIVVTAKTAQEDRLRGLQLGVDAYLDKPFNAEELIVCVKNLLDKHRLLRERYMQAKAEHKTDAEAELSPCDRTFLERIDAIVDKEMATGEISVDSVASALCMSQQQLRRKLSAISGDTPLAYIRALQMKRARQLLDDTGNIPIGEIAMKCGYFDTSHFTRAFKQTTGVTPTQYRKNKA